MWNPFSRGGETGHDHPDMVTPHGSEAGQDSLIRLANSAKGEAQRVLDSIIEARRKAGNIAGQENEQSWLELAYERLKRAIEAAQSAQARAKETSARSADDIAELERVRDQVQELLRPQEGVAA